MYAVIQTGGKQYRVAEGDRIEVELVDGDDVTLQPVLLVDGDNVLFTPSALEGAAVSPRLVGETKGSKIKGFTYKNKTNQRRHWGHRQHDSLLEITAISKKS